MTAALSSFALARVQGPEFRVARDLARLQQVDVAHDLADLGEGEVPDIHILVPLGGGKQRVDGGHPPGRIQTHMRHSSCLQNAPCSWRREQRQGKRSEPMREEKE